MFSILILIFLFFYTGIYAQVSQYQFQFLQGMYQEITGGAISTALGDDGGENINLPFSFTYNGISYNNARISVNGWLEMGQTYTGTGWLNDLASTTSKPLLCPLWDDLYADTLTQIRYEILGTAPTRVFVVQWKMVRWAKSFGGRQNFQVRIYETTNRISFHYGLMSTPSGASASIGINDEIGGSNHFISVTPGTVPTVSSTIANNNINSIAYLSPGLEYHFIPPVLQPSLYITQNTMVIPAGTTNQYILRLQLDQVSPQPVIDVTSFRFHLPSDVVPSNILKAKVYYTGNDNVFNTIEKFGETASQPDTVFTISGSKSLENGTHYFWLAFDINPLAPAGAIIDAACNYAVISGTTQMLPDTVSPYGHRTVTIGLSGSYTIGSSGNYTSLTAALNDLYNKGAGDHCTFIISSTYDTLAETFPIKLNEFPGADSNHTVTIFKDAGTEQLISCSANALFDFIGGSYYRIDGSNSLYLQNNLSLGVVIRIRDGSSHNIIRNCTIRGRSSSSTGGVIQFTTTIPAANNYNIIENCVIRNIPVLFNTPNTCIFMTGSSVKPNSFNIIRNCEILNFHDNGIYITGGTKETIIENNVIRFIPSSDFIPSSNNVNGIRLDNAPNTIIRGNKIYNLYSLLSALTTVRGIFIPGSFGVPMFIRIYNNFISLNHSSETENADIYGIDYYGYAENSVEIVHNSIFIGSGTNSGNPLFSYNITKRSSANQFIVKNNILLNGRNRYGFTKQVVMYFPDTSGLISSDYNNIYWYGTGGQSGYWETFDAFSLDNWKALSGQDFHSVAIPVTFNGAYDLHLSGSSVGNTSLAGEPYFGIVFDIDGDPRSATYPYIGADEIPSAPLPVEIISLYGVLHNNKVHIHFTTATETNTHSFSLERLNPKTGEFIFINQISATGNSSTPIDYVLIDEYPIPEENSYRIKITDYDGSFSYSDIITVNSSVSFEYELMQNYPNPFNSTTKILYRIPQNSKVVINIYDVLGNLVKTPVKNTQPAGEYSLMLDTTDWPSGIYYYSINAGSFYATRKMLLLK